MNRAEFVKEHSEKKARRLECEFKKVGGEIKDYYIAHDVKQENLISSLSTYINILIWNFLFFLMGMIYTVAKLKMAGVI